MCSCKSLTFLTAIVLVLGLASSSVLALSERDSRSKVTDTSGTELLPPLPKVARDIIRNPIVPLELPKRVALGATGRRGDEDVPYNVVDMTYDDLLYFNAGGFQVVQDETVNRKIHFAYQNRDDPTDNRQMGYQVYDPSAGPGSTFPQGTDGCIVQPGTDYGRNPKIDVFPNGRPIVAGFDSASGEMDFHAYWDLTGNCLWGAGSQLDPANYNNLPGMVQPENQLIVPIVRVQDVGGTLYTHVVTTGSGVENFWGESSESCPVVYYRSSGNPPNGTWTDGAVIDTTFTYYSFNMAVSRVSDNVVITYCKPTAAGILHLNGFYDEDVWYRESSDGGSSWYPPVNMTRYSRTDSSYTAWLECNPMYDSEDNLHIIWNAIPTPADPYGAGNMDWAYSWNSVYMHWRRLAFGGDTNTSIFHDANWANGGQYVCGFGGGGNLAASNATIGECGGRLYIVFSMANDMSVNPPLVNDCMSDNIDRFHSGMHDLYMVVSNDLTGDAWDAYRNITHTYSPSVSDEVHAGCDSASGGGVCYDEKSPSLYDMGHSISELPYNDIDSVLTAFYDPLEWYDPSQLPEAGVWTNDSALHLAYINDHWGGYASSGRGLHTLNEVAWMRVACVDPVVEPRITVTPKSVSRSDYVPNGMQRTVRVSLFNPGNASLSIDTIKTYEFSGSVLGWLDVSVATIPSIPPQCTGFFNIYLNKDGVINNGPGNTELAKGSVWIESNASNDPFFRISIEMLVADELPGLQSDTVATKADMFDKDANDHVALIVSNDGSMGHNGNLPAGGATMDFLNSTECNPAEARVYLCSGAPYVLQNTGNEAHLSTTLHSDGLAYDGSFLPDPDVDHGGVFEHGVDADSEWVYTGPFVNWDSSCVMTRKYIAPRGLELDYPSFIVTRTEFYMNHDHDEDVEHLSVGVLMDWDLPSHRGSDAVSAVDNTSGIVGGYIYIRGTDSAGYDGSACQSNANRYAGESIFYGYIETPDRMKRGFTPEAPFSSQFHDWWDNARDTVSEAIWDSLGAHELPSATGAREDLMVLQPVRHDFTLHKDEKLCFYSVILTLRDAGEADFAKAMDDAIDWAREHVCTECDSLSCCVGQRGDIDLDLNGDGSTCTPEEQIADIGDLTNLINHLFISFDPICCPEEADIAPVDTPNPGDVGDGVVDIGDLTSYINYLFITFVAPGGC